MVKTRTKKRNKVLTWTFAVGIIVMFFFSAILVTATTSPTYEDIYTAYTGQKVGIQIKVTYTTETQPAGGWFVKYRIHIHDFYVRCWTSSIFSGVGSVEHLEVYEGAQQTIWSADDISVNPGNKQWGLWKEIEVDAYSSWRTFNVRSGSPVSNVYIYGINEVVEQTGNGDTDRELNPSGLVPY